MRRIDMNIRFRQKDYSERKETGETDVKKLEEMIPIINSV